MGKRDEVKAGILIALSLLVLAGLIIGVSGVSLWEQYDRYTVRLRNTGGLDQGAPVRLGGLKIGKILGLRTPPEDTARVEITLGVRRGTPVAQGTTASVATLGLLGDTFLQLTTEAHSDQRIPPGSQIPGREAVQIAELLQRVDEVAKGTQVAVAHIDAFVSPANRERVERILGTVDQVIRENGESLRVVLENMTTASRRLDSTLVAVEGLVGENRADIRDVVRQLKADLEMAAGLIRGVEGTLAGVDRTLGSVNRVVEHADRVLLDNSEALDETVANLRRSTQNLREFTQSLKERPWNLVFPPDVPDKPGLEPRPVKGSSRRTESHQ
jgi:phospholipid/cholesterol/gamma-HCH transport system substrate-binding protein